MTLLRRRDCHRRGVRRREAHNAQVHPHLVAAPLQTRGQDDRVNVLVHPFAVVEALLVLPVLGLEEGGLLTGQLGDLRLVALEEGVAPTLVGKEGVGDLRQLGRRLEDAPQALEDALAPHDATPLRARLEVVRLLRIFLLRRLGPDHPASDHRASPPVHVDPCHVCPLQLTRAGAPLLGLADSGSRRSARWTCRQKSTTRRSPTSCSPWWGGGGRRRTSAMRPAAACPWGVHPAAVWNGCGESKHGHGIKVRLGVQAAEGAFVLAVVVGVRVGVRVGAGVPQP